MKLLNEEIERFIAGNKLAFVASADSTGVPHLAACRGIKVVDGGHLQFEEWFCPQTLRNIVQNPAVAVVVTEPAAGHGYLFNGTVESMVDTEFLDGYVPGMEQPGFPQVRSALRILVTEVLPFTAGIHSDLPAKAA
jgi:predicted pyridoxine 5'-phosphate oxidase superfamily flavin-nucleotide-binding protein